MNERLGDRDAQNERTLLRPDCSQVLHHAWQKTSTCIHILCLWQLIVCPSWEFWLELCAFFVRISLWKSWRHLYRHQYWERLVFKLVLTLYGAFAVIIIRITMAELIIIILSNITIDTIVDVIVIVTMVIIILTSMLGDYEAVS